MFFKDKPKVVPKHGEEFTCRQFAWRRTKVQGGWVWLEPYYLTVRFYQPVGGAPGWWSFVKAERGDLQY